MADIQLALTLAGQALNAKIQVGSGTVPLPITRIVASDDISGDPLTLTPGEVAIAQEFNVTGITTDGNRATINALLTNVGNPKTIPPVLPLAAGYLLSRIIFFANDPDNGEIVYRVTQFEKPIPVPAEKERPWTYKPTFNIYVGNASEVTVNVDPSGFATIKYVDDAIAAFPRVDYPIISDEEPPDLPIGGTWIGPLKDMGGDIVIVTPGGGSGTDKHNELQNLDYDKSGHTGFMKDGIIDGGTL